MTVPAVDLYSQSLEFAQREVFYARRRAQLALRHLDAIGDLPIPELQHLAHETLRHAVADYRGAIGKRAFEIRQLSV